MYSLLGFNRVGECTRLIPRELDGAKGLPDYIDEHRITPRFIVVQAGERKPLHPP